MQFYSRVVNETAIIFSDEEKTLGRPRKTWMEGVRAAMKTRHLEAD
jgi:hypothetical protein